MNGLTISKIYKMYDKKPLLSGLDLNVGSKETVCLLGASGSGKSTLLRIIAGLEEPESGSVYWNSEDLTNLPAYMRKFGFMFQDYALFPHLSVEQNIAFGMNTKLLSKAEIRSEISATLHRFNLPGYEARRVQDLSGGEQQRVALARTLASRPRLLLLDEPLAALDRNLRKQMLQEIRDALHEYGTPAIYVTHDQEEAFAIGDRISILEGGGFLQNGPPEEVFNYPATRQVANFLGLTNQVSGKLIGTHPTIVETRIGRFEVDPFLLKQFSIQKPTSVFIVLRKAIASMLTESQNINNAFSVKVEDVIFSENGYKTAVAANDLKMNFLLEQQFQIGEMIQLVIDPTNISIVLEK
jgi:spermidine/putrescine transport system ATP-binding protein